MFADLDHFWRSMIPASGVVYPLVGIFLSHVKGVIQTI